jgi:hypothetical protein
VCERFTSLHFNVASCQNQYFATHTKTDPIDELRIGHLSQKMRQRAARLPDAVTEGAARVGGLARRDCRRSRPASEAAGTGRVDPCFPEFILLCAKRQNSQHSVCLTRQHCSSGQQQAPAADIGESNSLPPLYSVQCAFSVHCSENCKLTLSPEGSYRVRASDLVLWIDSPSNQRWIEDVSMNWRHDSCQIRLNHSTECFAGSDENARRHRAQTKWRPINV